MKLKVVVHEAEEGGYWAEVPAIPGCATQGESFEDLGRGDPVRVLPTSARRGRRLRSCRDRSLADVTAEFVAVRGATMALLRHLDAAAWMRSGTMNGLTISVRAFAYIIAGHHALHLADLERYPALADQAHSSVPVR